MLVHFPGRALAAIQKKYYRKAPRDEGLQLTHPGQGLTPQERRKVFKLRKGGASWKEISQQLPNRPCCSATSLRNAWNTGGLSEDRAPETRKKRYVPWSEKDAKLLLKLRTQNCWAFLAIARKLGRTLSAVINRYERDTGIEHKPKHRVVATALRRYTPKEDQHIMSLRAAGLTPAEIAARTAPRRSLLSIRNRLYILRGRSGEIKRANPETLRLRQDLVDLRARGVPWKEIYAQYPNLSCACLERALYLAREFGMKPSDRRQSHIKD
jgi:hypothetical protein